MQIINICDIIKLMGKRINYSGDLPLTITRYDGNEQTKIQTTVNRRPYPGREQDMENLRQFSFSGKIGERALWLTQFDNGKSKDGASTLVVYGAGWGGNPTSTAAQLEMATMARALADEDGTPADALWLPTMAANKSVAEQMARFGSFSPLAEEIAPALDKEVADYDDLVIIGHSFGGRLVAAVPSVMGGGNVQKIESVTFDDPPSLKRSLGFAGLAIAQFTEDYRMQRYINSSQDSAAQAAWRGFDGLPMEAPSLCTQVYNIAAMAKSGFAGDLHKSAAVLPDSTVVTFVSPELSKMNAPGSIAEFAEEFSVRHPGLDVQHVNVEESSHNVIAGNPSYFGKLVTLGQK